MLSGMTDYAIVPIDKIDNTVRLEFYCNVRNIGGYTHYYDKSTLVTIVLSDDGKEVISVTKEEMPGKMIYMNGDIGLVRKLIYTDDNAGDFYELYATADGGKTWVSYKPSSTPDGITTVYRIIPSAK